METAKDTWYQVTVRIVSETLAPEEITAAISLQPTHEKRKGDSSEVIDDNSRYCAHLWGLRYTKDDAVPFEEQLCSLLDLLEERGASLKRLLSIEGVDGEILLGFGSSEGQGNTFFTPTLLRRICNLGFGIQLDLYPPLGD